MALHSRARKIKTLTNESGIPIDRKTKQLVFYECDVETVKQVTLKNGENFSREGANQVFELGYRKRQSRAILYCLTDRMRFQKRNTLGINPFRKQLTYREIKHFFVFPANPNVFMLCVVDEYSGKKLYEMYRCRPEDVNTICDLTYKASTDPQNLLRDVSPLRQTSITSRDYGTDPSPIGYCDSYENSIDDVKKPSTSYPAVTYPIQSKTGSVDRVLQNGYIKDNSELYSSRHDSFNCRSASPPPSCPNNDPSRRLPSQVESKVKGVYSCYELGPPKNIHYTTIDNIASHPHSSTETEQSKMQNSHSKQPNTSHSDFNPAQQTDLTSPTSKRYDFTKQNSPLFETQNMNNNHKNAVSHSHSNSSNQTRFSIHKPHSFRTKTTSRILIERDPAVNQSMRKFASVQNVNWGDEVTYISYNPISGTKICESGPMYMYITRYPSKQNLNNLNSEYRFAESSRLQTSTEQDEYEDWYRNNNHPYYPKPYQR